MSSRGMGLGLAAFAVATILLVCISGCSGDNSVEVGPEPDAIEVGQAEEVVAEREQTEATPKAAVKRTLGLAPFEYTTAVPSELQPPEGEWHCEWETGDGLRHIGKTLVHKYSVPGSYTVLWTIYSDGHIAASGEEVVEVLRIEDVRCESDAIESDIAAAGYAAPRPSSVDEEELASTVTLATEGGFALVLPEELEVVSFITYEPGQSSAAFAESDSYVFTCYGDVLYAVSKADGTQALSLDFGDVESGRVAVSAIAYATNRDSLYVLVYPNNEEEVQGTCYTVAPGTWEVSRLPFEAPTRAYTATFRAVYNEKTDQLLLLSSGVYAPPQLTIVDGTTGETMQQAGVRSSGSRGVHLDQERQALWLADNNVVLRIELDEFGMAASSAGVQLTCEGIAIDPLSGLCYCLQDRGNSSDSSAILVLDDSASTVLTGTIESLEPHKVHFLHQHGMEVVDRPTGRSLLVFGSEVYAISLSTLQIEESCPAVADLWTCGETRDGDLLFLDPDSLALFALERGARGISEIAIAPQPIAGIAEQLLDVAWDATSGVVFMLFRNLISKWDVESGDVSMISLEERITDSYRSTLDRMCLVSPSATGSVFLRLPGRAEAENPIYHAYWEGNSIVMVSNAAPTDCAVHYCKALASFVWMEDGVVHFSEKREPIELPSNVRWNEEAGFSLAEDGGTAVATSVQPRGLLAVVDLAESAVSDVLYLGQLCGNSLALLRDNSLWITSHGLVHHVDFAHRAGGPATCVSVPFSIEGSIMDFPSERRVGASRDGSIYTLIELDTGLIHVLDLEAGDRAD
jgi:hypothetical protein